MMENFGQEEMDVGRKGRYSDDGDFREFSLSQKADTLLFQVLDVLPCRGEENDKGSLISADMDVIPSELWCLIGSKLDSFRDRVSFRAVSKSWRSLLPPPRHPPCLLLAESEGRDETPPCRHFLCFERRKIYKVEFPEIHRADCVGTAGSWLLSIDENENTSLTNLFTRVHTHPIPDDKGYYKEDNFNKIVLSSPPWDGGSCSALAMQSRWEVLAIARPGDTSWTTWTSFPDGRYLYNQDIIYHKQQFYMINLHGELSLCNIGDDLHPPTLSIINNSDCRFGEQCLVEWLGELLVIHFIHPQVELPANRVARGQTNEINIYKVDLTGGKRTVLKSLGEHSLFVGAQNTCVSVLASDYFGLVRKNCIYFVDASDPCESIKQSYDVRVFDVEDKSISTYYKGIPWGLPPVWIVPSQTTL